MNLVFIENKENFAIINRLIKADLKNTIHVPFQVF